MDNIKLSPRLLKVAELVSGKTVADIGTDHGKLLIYLLKKNKINFGIGSDVADGPASACRKNVFLYGLSDKIEVRIGDGLETISENEIESIIIAGMGGELILKILSENINVAQSAKEIIVQPMTNIGRMLEGLNSIELKVCDAYIVSEKDKLYQIFKLKKGRRNDLKPIDFVICPEHFKRKSKQLSELLKREIKKYKIQREGILNSIDADMSEILNLDEIIKELEAYEDEFNY